MELFCPFVELNIAGRAVLRNHLKTFDVWLSRKEPADVCAFMLKPEVPDLSITKDTQINVSIGYSLTQKWQVLSGFVTDPAHPAYIVKDGAIKLFRTKIVQTFMDATPQDIINFGLRAAGISEVSLDQNSYPGKKRFVAASENVSELVHRVNTTWGIANDWYFSGQKFCWNSDVPLSGKPVYVYEWGKNIIDLSFKMARDQYGQRAAGATTGAGKLITVVSPFVEHSQEVKIIWPGIKNTRFVIETIHHYLNDKGVLRTDFMFRELEA